MDNTTEQQSKGNGTGPVSSPQVVTAKAILEKLSQWAAAIDPRLQNQMTLLEMLEEYLLIELRTHYSEGNIDQHFIGVLLDTVLQRMIDQKPLSYDEEQDAPYRWPGGADLGFPAERRDVLTQIVESASSGFIKHYKDYLHRHWSLTGEDTALVRAVEQKRAEHLAAISTLFQRDQLVAMSVDELREKVEETQGAWRRALQITALATSQERQRLEAIAHSQLPGWLRALSEPDQALLQDYLQQTSQAQELVDEQLEGLDSLRAYARRLIRDYVRVELGMEVDPDSIQLRLQWKTVVGEPVHTCNLSELLAGGPLRNDTISVLSVKNGTMRRNQPLSPEFMTRLLADVDAPAGYLQALTDQYGRAELKDAMLDWYTARLWQSAFIARCAGHLSVTGHDSFKALWESGLSQRSATVLRVCGLELPNALECADLLLFYREDEQGAASDLLLYAPGKPDGQEWIELVSLRALSAEIGGWTKNEAGREYLLQQLDPSRRGAAEAFFITTLDKPASWDLSKDLRGAVAGLVFCLADAVEMGLANHLKQVELSESPRWYSARPIDSRRLISSLGHELRVHQQVFNDQLASYEVFVDFAKRTVMHEIAPYMRSKGVREPVDPATVLIDYHPGLADGQAKVASLLELAIHGYDDNSGIDHPQKGVRSSVGQDLRQVRSAELAPYIRSAYLGEKYARHIRARFLTVTDPAYDGRRDAYKRMLRVKMDRDLRVAHGKSRLNDEEFSKLTRQVTLLDRRDVAGSPSHPSAVVAREGLVKFTLGGHVVLGAYVFTYFDSTGAHYWLYTPDAPDGVMFRPYWGFFGEVVAQLHDYLLGRVALSARAAARRSLTALRASTTRVDTLREFNRVSDLKTEFDAYITRALTDVEHVTKSRAEVITHQVIKGLLLATVPVCMVYPPFALLLDVVFIVISSRQAIEAHSEGDTAGALEHWLHASWGALFAVLGAGAAVMLLGLAARNLKTAVRPLSLAAQRLKKVTSVAAREGGPVIQPIRFKPKQAVRATPENLQLVTEQSLYRGTYRSPASASQPLDTYYIASKGRYYQVRRDPYFDGLCLVDASRPGAFYKQPITRMANGKWTFNKVGLRGGNGEVRDLGSITDLREVFHGAPIMERGALQGEAVVGRFRAHAHANYLFSLNGQTTVIASLYNPSNKLGAVIHYDHNIGHLIERSVRDLIRRLGGSAKDIRVTLVGGVGQVDGGIGSSVRSVMSTLGLSPTGHHWTHYTSWNSIHGVSLNLENGVTSVFRTSRSLVERYYSFTLSQAKYPFGSLADPILVRSRMFLRRTESERLLERADGFVYDGAGAPGSARDIESFKFHAVDLTVEMSPSVSLP